MPTKTRNSSKVASKFLLFRPCQNTYVFGCLGGYDNARILNISYDLSFLREVMRCL